MKSDYIQRVKPTLNDRTQYANSRLKIYSKIAALLLKHGPINMIGELRRHPWMKNIFNAHELLEMTTCTRTGLYREANVFALVDLVSGVLDLVDGLYMAPDRVILHEDLIPPEILEAMGLAPWMVEILGILAPMINRNFSEEYIDIAENAGIPPDVCSLPKATIGMTLRQEIPKPVAMVTSNMPCDGGMSSYTIIERELKVPTFNLDTPYNFYNDRAVHYFVGELKRMIAWLEAQTPGRMDWDRLRQICEERNRAVSYELELWDILRNKPAPLAAEPIYLGHMLHMIARPGTTKATHYFKKMVEMATRIHENGQGALPERPHQ